MKVTFHCKRNQYNQTPGQKPSGRKKENKRTRNKEKRPRDPNREENPESELVSDRICNQAIFCLLEMHVLKYVHYLALTLQYNTCGHVIILVDN
jgi:hypothetical protein